MEGRERERERERERRERERERERERRWGRKGQDQWKGKMRRLL